PDNQVLYWLNRVNGSLAKMKDPLMTGELAKSREEIEKLGLALSSAQFDNIHNARVEFEKMESLASGVWEHVQAAAAPAISMVLEGINNWITKTAEAHGGFRRLGRDIALFILDGVKKASEAIYQFVDGIGQNIKRSQLNYGWGGVSQQDRQQYAELVDLTKRVKEARKTLTDEYQHNGGHEVYAGQLSQIARLTQLQDTLNKKMKEMLSLDGHGEFYQSLITDFEKARQAITDAGSGDDDSDSSNSSGKPPLGASPIIDIRKMKGAVGEFSRLRQQVEQDNADSLQRLVLQEQEARQKIITSGREAGKTQNCTPASVRNWLNSTRQLNSCSGNTLMFPPCWLSFDGATCSMKRSIRTRLENSGLIPSRKWRNCTLTELLLQKTKRSLTLIRWLP
ncbi:hypothetical protein ACQSGA_26980, partial [Salmonella enterica]|uniref:hypothetical protein n=1 Tax=Salmonella enterica TaxID=28901 RepID=UPI003D323686